jgi:hypothetical protein
MHSDHIMANAPTLTSVLNLFDTMKPISKTLATLVGGYKLEAAWMIDNIDLVKRHWKKRCLMVSSW